MAGSKGSKYYNVFLNYSFSLESEEEDTILNHEGFGILNAVRKTRSLASAAAEMGISYRKAWGMIREVEMKLGFPLVIKQRGGLEGGHTRLSEEGNELIDAFNELTKQYDISMREVTRKFFRTIND